MYGTEGVGRGEDGREGRCIEQGRLGVAIDLRLGRGILSHDAEKKSKVLDRATKEKKRRGIAEQRESALTWRTPRAVKASL